MNMRKLIVALTLFSPAFAGDGLNARSAVERARAFRALGGKTPALVAALGNRHVDVRIRAVRALSGTSDTKALRGLAHRALYDETAIVRALAVKSMRQSRRRDLSRLFTPALRSKRTRARAAEALGALGARGAVGPLIAALSAGGTGQRVYLSSMTQVAYIQDYDVEVA